MAAADVVPSTSAAAGIRRAGSPVRGAHARDSGPSRAGRTGWVPQTPSPGPGAYYPSTSQSSRVLSPERAVFGTANRDNEGKRFISQLHNSAMPNESSPGPGTYRTQTVALHRTGVTTKFGSEAQRPSMSRDSLTKPGPVYELPSGLTRIGTHFAPPGGLENGQARSREESLKLFLSKQHSVVERSPYEQEDMPSPNQYDLVTPDVDSKHDRAPGYSFGRSHRDVRAGYTQEQLRADPGATTFAETPAPYDVRGGLSLKQSSAPVFGTGQRSFSPDRDKPHSRGPFISKLHAAAVPQADSPAPGTYEAKSGLDSPTGPKFGSANSKDRSPMRGTTQVPGPGAHTPKLDALSRITTGASYSMGANLRTDFASFAPAGPGPGAYSLPHAGSSKQASPAYSLGDAGSKGRSSFIAPSITPAPNAYGVPDQAMHGIGGTSGINRSFSGEAPGSPKSPRDRGFSFGAKERTKHEKSTISIRYHGPLAAIEAMGTEGPGPAQYDVRGIAAKSGRSPSPTSKFGTGTRDGGSKVFISSLHATAAWTGLETPGPASYTLEGDVVTSKYKHQGGPKFGTGGRFNAKGTTF